MTDAEVLSSLATFRLVRVGGGGVYASIGEAWHALARGEEIGPADFHILSEPKATIRTEQQARLLASRS
ncbi:MAG: hypothetical protein BroJett013_22880 [Alphaproteobacteria bacterium]|nr:MAG: hypothetical protein BroJett013_22880 [Alphaproteobacteria bacterium]